MPACQPRCCALGSLRAATPAWADQRRFADPLCPPVHAMIAPRSNPPAALAPGKWGEVSRDIRRVLDRFRQVSRLCTPVSRFWRSSQQVLGAPQHSCSGLHPARGAVSCLLFACLRTECPQPLPARSSAGESDGWGERARQRRGRRGRRPQREVFEQQVRLGWSS